MIWFLLFTIPFETFPWKLRVCVAKFSSLLCVGLTHIEIGKIQIVYEKCHQDEIC